MDPDTRESTVWASIDALAARDGRTPSVEHACVACVAAVSASGGGLSMTGPEGVGEPLFAADPASRAVQELQSTLGQGPCVDALDDQRAVLVADLASLTSTRRWPLFSPAAASLGVLAVFSFPIRTGAIRFGVLDLYRPVTGPLSRIEMTDALLYAEAALTLALDGDRGHDSIERLLDTEFAGRQAQVHQAAGMVSVQLGVSIGDGMARLRAHAFAQGRGLGQTAADVVTRKVRFHQDLDPVYTSESDDAGDESSSDSEG